MSCIEANYIPYHADIWMGRGKALIFAPHPDDEVFGCGGAILRHLAAGDEVKVIIVTDGGFGGEGDGGLYVRRRQNESLRAAEILGYGVPDFWGYPDRGLKADEDLLERIALEIEKEQPAYVYAPSWWEIHPDHTALSWAVSKGLSLAALEFNLYFYEIGIPLPPNCLLDITEVVEVKRSAMFAFQSQLGIQSYESQVLALNRFRSYTLGPNVHYAEAFRRVTKAGLQGGKGEGSLSLEVNELWWGGRQELQHNSDTKEISPASSERWDTLLRFIQKIKTTFFINQDKG